MEIFNFFGKKEKNEKKKKMKLKNFIARFSVCERKYGDCFFMNNLSVTEVN